MKQIAVAEVKDKWVLRDNSWVHIGTSNTVIVFIHGLFSTSSSCWTHESGTSWPRLVAEDPFFRGASVFVASIPTAISSGSFDINQCAKALLAELRLRPQDHTCPLDHENIVFVCHSLGGVVMRRVLEQDRDYFKDKHVGIVLIASPSLGSGYATGLKRIAKIYKNKVALELGMNGDAIRDIDDRFRELLRRNSFGSLTGAEACEHHGPIYAKWLPISLPPIVSSNSASCYFGGVETIFETDHFSIAKPDKLDHRSHKFLQRYFADNVERRVVHAPVNSTDPSIAVRADTPDPLFDVYSKRHSSFYIGRQEDDRIARVLKTGSVWIHGDSGFGKTTLAKRWTSENQHSPIEIPLSHLGASNTRNQLFDEIIQSLQAVGTKTCMQGLPGAVEAISLKSSSTIVPIFLDEVPLGAEELQIEVPAAIATLLETVKRKCDKDVKFLVCSILSPLGEHSTQKMREQFTVLPLLGWDRKDLTRLFELLKTSMNLSISGQIAALVVERADGSPRFIKVFFRRLITGPYSGEEAAQRALHEATQAMRRP